MPNICMLFAAPANLGDAGATTSRLDRILRLGEIVARLASLGQAFVDKFFPSEESDPCDLQLLPDALEKAIAMHDEQLRSAARGAAKVALALMLAWYPDVDIRQMTEFMPTEDDNDQPINAVELLVSVQGYATRVANMVDIRNFYIEHPDPHLAGPILAEPESAPADEGSLQDGGASPKDVEASPKDAGTSSQDPPTAPSL